MQKTLVLRFDSRKSNTLNLASLSDGMPGITPLLGACFAEAAGRCLEEGNHQTGVTMRIEGVCVHNVNVIWDSSGDAAQRKRAWSDPDVSTEYGAYGMAALLVHQLTEHTVVERARKGGGFDFWLGEKHADTDSSQGEQDYLFQGKTRLEVSGIQNGSRRDVSLRLRQKMKQMRPSDANSPGVAIVVEFGAPQAQVKTK